MVVSTHLDLRTRRADAGPSVRTRWLASAVALVIPVAALPTFFVDDLLNGPPVMNGSARGTALVMTTLALAVLVAGVVTAARSSLRGHAALIGALAYVTYNAMLFVYATPFNELFLVYVALLGLAFWTLTSALLDPLPRVPAGPHLPVRAIAGFILAVAGLNVLAWLRFVVPDLTEYPPGFLEGTGLTTNPIYVQDLALWIPALCIVAVMLWQRRPVGVFLAGAALVFWLLEAVGVAVDQWFGHRAAPDSTVATTGGVVLFVVVALATAVPLALWWRAVLADRRSRAIGPSPTGRRPVAGHPRSEERDR